MKHDVLPNYDGIIMQFTGLYDKKGEEIYEGDIVKRDENKYEVHYNVDWGALYYGPYFLKKDSDVEVIGNIYENPELLK